MPFKLGAAPVRRTLKYLEAGKLVFKDRVKIMTVHFNTDEEKDYIKFRHTSKAPTYEARNRKPFERKLNPSHKGCAEFVFWTLPQITYKNPRVQITTVKNETPSPYITCYMEDGEKVLFDVDSQSSNDILLRLIRTLGKTKATLAAEAIAAKKGNPANFGRDCDRLCACIIPGQGSKKAPLLERTWG